MFTSQPDRIKHFGAVSHDQDGTRNVPSRPGLGLRSSNSAVRPSKEKPPLDSKEKAPPARPRQAFQSPLLDYSAALEALAGTGATAGLMGNGLIPLAQSEDFHRNLSNTLGEIAASQYVKMSFSAYECTECEWELQHFAFGGCCMVSSASMWPPGVSTIPHSVCSVLQNPQCSPSCSSHGH